jgi:hypothetical protein
MTPRFNVVIEYRLPRLTDLLWRAAGNAYAFERGPDDGGKDHRRQREEMSIAQKREAV